MGDGDTGAGPRAEVEAWLAEHWDPDLSVERWWRLVAAAGWTAPHFSVEQGGRGLPQRAGRTVRAAFAAFGALEPPGGLGLLMAAPTILALGTPEQIARHVPPILEGRLGWCQLFSEPGAGSDLAGLTTRAQRDGDNWVINGQKVWSSQAREADYGMLLARTDFDVPKHAGISWFALNLDQPGVTIRPLREMTGDAVFNEVFFDNAVVPAADLVGGEGNGWMAANTTLHFERTGIGAGGAHAGFPPPGPKGGVLGMRAGDAARLRAPEGMVVTFADLVALAHEHGRADDPTIRDALARLHCYVQVGQWNAARAKAEAAAGNAGAGTAIASMGKIAQTRITKLAAEIGMDILGAGGLLAGPDGAADGKFAKAFVFSPASSIYGGTDEIQRNIAAERTLGLPREPNPDRDRPYREVLRGQRRA
ncbi:acyl-CoA dehydrogenase family protein [Frankia sp. CNm7]|uniref:Acyl-CoA dehydrogenase family protein n=1 Tax=Frankia nepalensis TaxID=1836974 RepID=A0A937RL70_9ACTN|nr:acyl-CoA dehydrogenase family protein [Frankia nepalensis]MBL7495056.1 acyl-CoA dehydrogenase family protein [Frankia nepalensis]MBL7515242.1 acyl-CoA dehydrogenase family protein [Frankia nepalensis]MBL7522186.1 acyl-CoA dehydrogenase family protein [Frankia nepalensis]MBL7632300.1 acyl-CoA dehydrogenase family protein [Frankia nepalensis]